MQPRARAREVAETRVRAKGDPDCGQNLQARSRCRRFDSRDVRSVDTYHATEIRERDASVDSHAANLLTDLDPRSSHPHRCLARDRDSRDGHADNETGWRSTATYPRRFIPRQNRGPPARSEQCQLDATASRRHGRNTRRQPLSRRNRAHHARMRPHQTCGDLFEPRTRPTVAIGRDIVVRDGPTQRGEPR